MRRAVCVKPDNSPTAPVYGGTFTRNSGPVAEFFVSGGITAKQRDEETKLLYVSARYLDSKVGRWLSADPAMGEYIPRAPINDEAKKYNENLPGMGGVFNVLNFHTFAYTHNNPINLVDPDGRDPNYPTAWNAFNLDFGKDYMDLTVSNFKKGHYAYGILMFLDSVCEATYDLLLAYCGASFVGAISSGALTVSAGGGSIWALDQFARGRAIEQSLGMNLPSNFPVIDKFLNGIATSIKSLDINAASYQNLSTLKNTLTGYVNSVANFLTQPDAIQRWDGAVVKGADITGRTLELALPSLGNAGQQQVLQDVAQYAKSVGVNLFVWIIE